MLNVNEGFKELSETINYHFQNPDLLKIALTHPSICAKQNYERLEFLGDSIINMLVSDLLITLFPDDKEGDLSQKRVKLVCQSQLVAIASLLKLTRYIIMSDQEEKSGGKDKKSILENTLEALTAAIYLDGGFLAAKSFVWYFWYSAAEIMLEAPKNPKSELQEWLQSRNLPLPTYIIVEKIGDEHSPIFTIQVSAGIYGEAASKGSTKKIAEQLAAAALLKKLVYKING